MTEIQRHIIRPSMLPMYGDCSRREAARTYRSLVEAAGYKLRQLEPHIGAAVGSAVHAATAYTLLQRIDTDTDGTESDAVAHAIDGYWDSASNGVMFDKVTPESNTAEKQIIRMVKTYRDVVAPKLKPIQVEKRLTVLIGDGFAVSGQADMLAIEPGSIHDTKTGAVQRISAPQTGCYSLLARTPRKDGGAGHHVERIAEDFIGRVTLKKPQSQPVTITYPVAIAEGAAERLINQVKHDVTAFLQTGDPQSFIANPNSILCSDRFCPAHGTKWCLEHKR